MVSPLVDGRRRQFTVGKYRSWQAIRTLGAASYGGPISFLNNTQGRDTLGQCDSAPLTGAQAATGALHVVATASFRRLRKPKQLTTPTTWTNYTRPNLRVASLERLA